MQHYIFQPENDMFRITAAVDNSIAAVRTGDKGGLIEFPQNLGPDCWIDGTSEVRGPIVLEDGSIVKNGSQISGKGLLKNVLITNSRLTGELTLDTVTVNKTTALACELDLVRSILLKCNLNGSLRGWDVSLKDSTLIGNIEIFTSSVMTSTLEGAVEIVSCRDFRRSTLTGEVRVISVDTFDGCNIQLSSGKATVARLRMIEGLHTSLPLQIYSKRDHVQLINVGRENGTLHAFMTAEGLRIQRGCFTGNLEDFIAAVEKRYGTTHVGVEYKFLIEFLKMRFKGRSL